MEINNQMRLSPHFTLGEFTVSRSHPDVKNIPNEVAVENLKRLCEWLEVLRERYNQWYVSPEESEPIVITSGYRSLQLNLRVGGSTYSNHLTGCAADIRCIGIEQALRYAVILMDYADQEHLSFDELLLEKKGHVYWLHFAVRPPSEPNRRHVGLLIV